MTLFKQVAIVVSLVFLLIVVATTIGNIKRSGAFIEGQLQTTAQDMVTTLGIAISNSSSVNDVASYETLFNVVFDSGYYSSIELIAADGKILHKKYRQMEIHNVPDWFIELIPLSPATGTTPVMRGWVPLGTLKLVLHPGYVYSILYKNLQASLFWFIILFSIGMVALWLVLHQLMKPLSQVKQQADAIHNNKFEQQSTLPRTLELRSVVETMNRMVEKVHRVFNDQEKTLGLYQKLLYEDKATGLGNRQYFMAELERTQSEETLFHGSLAVIKIQNFDYIHDHFGYEKSNQIIRVIAKILKEDLGNHTVNECARLTGDEFSLLFSEGEVTVVEYLESIFDRFKSNDLVLEFADKISLTAGVSNVTRGLGIGGILSESDFALTQANAAGPYSVYEKLSTDITLPQGKMQWRIFLEHSISENKLFLVRQKVLDNKGVAIHQEVFVRLKNDDGEIVSAGIFIPVADALGLGESIDRVVFQLVKQLSKKPDNIPVAINLTVSVFSHADALLEFNQLLEFFQNASTGLCVEASHTIIEKYPVMCTEVADSVRKAGHSFGIDNLNLAHSLEILQAVRPDYVKINSRTLYDMTKGDVPAAYQALLTLTNTLDIRLIAVGVETQEVYDHLSKLGVGTMQGNLLSELEELE